MVVFISSDQYWKKDGPIFVDTGKAGDVWDLALNSGFIVELAAEQRGLVILAEHARSSFEERSQIR